MYIQLYDCIWPIFFLEKDNLFSIYAIEVIFLRNSQTSSYVHYKEQPNYGGKLVCLTHKFSSGLLSCIFIQMIVW